MVPSPSPCWLVVEVTAGGWRCGVGRGLANMALLARAGTVTRYGRHRMALLRYDRHMALLRTVRPAHGYGTTGARLAGDTITLINSGRGGGEAPDVVTAGGCGCAR